MASAATAGKHLLFAFISVPPYLLRSLQIESLRFISVCVPENNLAARCALLITGHIDNQRSVGLISETIFSISVVFNKLAFM
jgi:hypothetical protein